jgi:hypothetical protein
MARDLFRCFGAALDDTKKLQRIKAIKPKILDGYAVSALRFVNMLRRITQVNILFAEALKENPLLRSEKLAFRLTLATADIYELARPNPQVKHNPQMNKDQRIAYRVIPGHAA